MHTLLDSAIGVATAYLVGVAELSNTILVHYHCEGTCPNQALVVVVMISLEHILEHLLGQPIVSILPWMSFT